MKIKGIVKLGPWRSVIHNLLDTLEKGVPFCRINLLIGVKIQCENAGPSSEENCVITCAHNMIELEFLLKIAGMFMLLIF